MATQAMVWVITGGQYGTSWETRIADNLLQDNPTARSIYNQIRNNMESYSTIPSFTASSSSNAKDYEMKYNMNSGKFELTLEDGNNALKHFDFSATGISVQRNSNKLTLSAPTEKQFDTITLKANKNLPKDVLPSLISGTPSFISVGKVPFNNRAVILGLIDKNPAQMIGNIKSKKPSVDFWTLEEFQKVISLLYKGDYYEHYLFISFWLLFMTGMRIGEASALQWEDIDFETGIVNIDKTLYYQRQSQYDFVDPKTKASIRKIVIDEDTIKELKAWKDVQKQVLKNCGFVLSYSGIPTSKHNSLELWRNWLTLQEYIVSRFMLYVTLTLPYSSVWEKIRLSSKTV